MAKKSGKPPPRPQKASEGFNTPFRELKAAASRAPARPAPPPPPARPVGRDDRASDDQRLFEQAMRGVVPLARADRTRRAAPSPDAAPSRINSAARARREDALAEAELAELVAGSGRLTVEESGETMSGRAAGIDRRLLRRLRDGEYPVEAEVDLHGLTREQALAALDRTLRRAAAENRRALLIIHGRGLNSGAEGPVLKDAVREALCAGPLARLVLAFTSAPPDRGGPGATLVLLRKAVR